MDKYKEISVEDIKLLLKKNEEDRILAEKIMDARKSGYNPYPNGWNRHDFYREVFSDMYIDGFVMQYPHGSVIRQAQRSFYYRGENQIYETSQPSLCRKLNKIDNEEVKHVEEFVSNLRVADFLDLLLHFEHAKMFMNNSVDILYEQLAQHYGFETKWLDVTTDFEVALFFACCKYNNESNKWEPLNHVDFNKKEESSYGVIFRKNVNDFSKFLPSDLQTLAILPIGFQPFMRCHMQFGYAIHMDTHMNLQDDKYFEIFKFRHSEELCNFIFQRMDFGRQIYPHEGLNLMSDEIDGIKKRKIFSRDTFDFVCEDDKNCNKKELETLLNKYNYQIKEIPINCFSNQRIGEVNKLYDSFDIEKTYNIKLRTRLTYSPPNK